MELHGNYKRVFNLLRIGSDNAMTCKEISRLLNLTPRTVRECIRNLILKYKIPIIAKRKGNNRGYFIPSNDSELLQGIITLESQLTEEEKRLSILNEIDLQAFLNKYRGSKNV